MIVGILLFQAVAFAVLSAIVADRKNRDPFGWSIIGFLFGLFGFIAAIAVGKVEEPQSSSRQRNQPSGSQEFDPEEHEKKCPMCAERIKLEARVCRYCGHEFSEEDVEKKIEEVKQKTMERKPKRSPDEGNRLAADEPREPSTKATMTIIGAAVVIVLILAATVWAVAGAT